MRRFNMRYQNITLNRNDEEKVIYSLVMYNKKYKRQLDCLKKLNQNIARQVKRCNGDKYDLQAYMIFRNTSKCIGGILIDTSDKETLCIKIIIESAYFINEEEVIMFIERLINTLGLYFYEKENIAIQLLNNIDLTKSKNSLFINLDDNTYAYSNLYMNKLISALLLEIESAFKIEGWASHFEIRDDADIFDDFNESIKREYLKECIPLSEIFNKMSKVILENEKENKRIVFNCNGDIEYQKFSEHDKSQDFSFSYNVMQKGFQFISHTKNCFVEEKYHYPNYLSLDDVNEVLRQVKDDIPLPILKSRVKACLLDDKTEDLKASIKYFENYNCEFTRKRRKKGKNKR